MARRVGLALVVTLAVAALVGCDTTTSPSVALPPPADAASPGPASLGTTSVQRAVESLARLGVETRVRPSDSDPIARIEGDRSFVRLLRVQVRNLALEHAAGAGTLGADLDRLSEAAGGGPVSPLLAAWMDTIPTDAAGWAASLRSQEQPHDPAAEVFPTLVLVAFVADVHSDAGGAATSPADAVTANHIGTSGSGSGVPARLAVATGSGFCAEVSAYLSAALNDIVDADADPPAWWQQLIEVYASQYAGDPELLRRTIGAIALVTYATSLARPWTVNVAPDPPATTYGVEGEEPVVGDVVVTVASGEDVFADDVADCAALADAQLASTPIEGSLVVWDSSGLGGHAKEVSSFTMLDDNASAGLTYQTTTESADVAATGDAVSASMGVSAWVERGEMAALASVVKSILLGEAAGTPAGSSAKVLYKAMEATLSMVMRPSGFALIDVTYHTPKASPNPTTGTLTGTWVGAYTLNGRSDWGFTMVLSQSGKVVTGTGEVTGPTCVTHQTIAGTTEGANVELVQKGERDVTLVGTVDGDSMAGTWTAISCGPPYAMPDTPIDGTWEAARSD